MKCRFIPFLLLTVSMLVLNNAHLPVFQVVAWAGMLMDYSRNATLAEAVDKTFSGDYPCPMCRAIEKEQTQNKAPSPEILIANRLLLFAEFPGSWSCPLMCLHTLSGDTQRGEYIPSEPETPPPRLHS